MNFTPDALLQTLDRVQRSRPARLWIAFSGGLDSTVLLHALARGRDRLPPLAAVHVDHQLHPDSGDWAVHCGSTCAALGIPLETFAVTVGDAPGTSVEAAARDARYQVFRELLAADEALLTAQHQDDQFETFLLQALRGAGPHGLAAMPERAVLGRGWLLRPLLEWPRAALEDWARAQDLQWLDDPSNAHDRFDRNFLRLNVLPALRARWPAAAQTVARSARHCAEAAAVMDTLAAADLAEHGRGNALEVAALRRLEAARRRNLVRHWLDWQGFPRPSEKKLEHILSDVLEAAPDAEPCVAWANVVVRRYRNALYAERELSAPRSGTWRTAEFTLGEGWGTLQRVKTGAPGLPLAGEFEVRFRTGGERIRPLGRAHHHELKKLFQEAAVLPWRRAHVPLVYVDTRLAAVGDLWIDADVAETPGFQVRWDDKPKITAI